MPAVDNELHVDLIRDALTARGFTGITLDATAYPDGTNAIKVVNDFVIALQDAQQVQNDAAATGADVSLVTRAVGPTEDREYPPGSGTNIAVNPVAISLNFAQQSAVVTTIPNLV